MKRNAPFAIGEYYHLYNRGVSKMPIFLDDQDHDRFQKLLFISNSQNTYRFYDNKKNQQIYTIDRREPLVAIGSYCPMPNHFHILAKEITEGGTSLFMKKVLTAYSMYFNSKYKRTGTLFEGRFKSKLASSDELLKYYFSYIHLNPVKLIEPHWKEDGIKDIDKAFEFLKNYKYSSFPDFIGPKRVERAILNLKVFPEYFETINDFKEFINDWLGYQAR